MQQATLPLLATVWFVVLAPIVVIDGIFVLTRATSPGGAHPLGDTVPFSYWAIYAKYDRRYAPNDDAFVVAQSWLNIVEVVMGLLTALLGLCKVNNLAIKLAIVVNMMTLYKTVMYYLIDIAENGKYTHHNTFQEQLLMVILPSSFWIIIPCIILRQCFRALNVAQVRAPSKAKPPQPQPQPQPQQSQQNKQHQQQSSNGNNANNGKNQNKKKK